VDRRRAREGEGPVWRRARGDAHNGRLAAAVFAQLQKLGDHVARPEGLQPFGVVAGDGRLVAANRPLFDLLGCDEGDLLGSRWERTMPAWGSRAHLDAPDQFTVCLYPPRRDDLGSLVPAHAWVHPVADAVGVLSHTFLLTPHASPDL
jgi:hypothetical protein